MRGWSNKDEDEANDEEEVLLDTVAVKVSRALNMPTENRLLAQQIVRAARSNADDFLGFTTSLFYFITLPTTFMSCSCMFFD